MYFKNTNCNLNKGVCEPREDFIIHRYNLQELDGDKVNHILRIFHFVHTVSTISIILAFWEKLKATIGTSF